MVHNVSCFNYTLLTLLTSITLRYLDCIQLPRWLVATLAHLGKGALANLVVKIIFGEESFLRVALVADIGKKEAGRRLVAEIGFGLNLV